ncbi:hypothetical protein FOCC_FOCC000855 [Frankliniella occidentalis]|nr:hypothetical protein FOCC_FOCC000855 [Frankliniella occidentalis]
MRKLGPSRARAERCSFAARSPGSSAPRRSQLALASPCQMSRSRTGDWCLTSSLMLPCSTSRTVSVLVV